MFLNHTRDAVGIDVMQLTLKHRLKLCWEILTTTSGHAHPSQEKQLSVYRRGYDAGMYENKSKYSELLYAVDSKFPGESRHETALRYIQTAEQRRHR